MTDAISIIKREHRAIAAVLHCLEHLAKDEHEHRLDVDPEAFEAILDYVQDFPDRFHHPKEDDHLYAALIARHPASKDLIDDLQDQHRKGDRLIAELRSKFLDWRSGRTDFEPFYALALAYVDFQRRHIGQEEQKALPAAKAHLTEADWQMIDAAFSDNDDPIFGDNPKRVFDKLFDRIVEKAPVPYGVGERKAPPPAATATPEDRREVLSLYWI